ncbi:MAG: hypothetical protein K8R88_14355 [Armatimonadetes bacterium]|nr:hypothetical protein [Armatimonadota bacterium]
MFLSIIWVPWMFWRTAKRKEKPNWQERCGNFSLKLDKKKPTIWFHAVSVGEVVAARPILAAIRDLAPQAQILLSVTTSSGHQTAREGSVGLYDALVYFPLDVPKFQLAAFSRVRPQVVAIMETELWYNFLYFAKSFRATTMLINGRISDRSFPRSLKLKFFYKSMLTNLDQALMQGPTDAERITALGANSTEVLGNSKFDQAASGVDKSKSDWRAELDIPAEAFCIVVGSTRGTDEEKIIIDALPEDSHVIFAPRHLERAPEVQALIPDSRLRSKGETGPRLILDTYGELGSIYAAADLAIIGGSFGEYGGQNLIQPLAHGVPTIYGPHMENFQSAAREAEETGASLRVTAQELALTIQRLRHNPADLARMGEAGKSLVSRSQGASRRYAERIVGYLK